MFFLVLVKILAMKVESFDVRAKVFWRTLHPPQSLTKPNINPQNMTKLPTHQLLQLKTIACCSFRMNCMFKNFEVQGLRWYCFPFYFIIFVSLFEFFLQKSVFYVFFPKKRWFDIVLLSISDKNVEFLLLLPQQKNF